MDEIKKQLITKVAKYLNQAIKLDSDAVNGLFIPRVKVNYKLRRIPFLQADEEPDGSYTMCLTGFINGLIASKKYCLFAFYEKDKLMGRTKIVQFGIGVKDGEAISDVLEV